MFFFIHRQNEYKRAFLLAEESSEEEETDSDLEEEIEGYAGKNAGMCYDDDAGTGMYQVDEEKEEVVEIFRCTVCNKDFKSSMQLNQHLASKNHRKAEQEFNKKNKSIKGGGGRKKAAAGGVEDDLSKGLEDSVGLGCNDGNDTNSEIDNDVNNDSNDAVTYKRNKNDKKKKKKESKKMQKQKKQLDEDDNSDSNDNNETFTEEHVFQLRGKETSFSCRECLTGNHTK